MRLAILLSSLAVALGAVSAADAAPCDDCFAVLLLPDTQFYTQQTANQPQRGNHFRAITRYACDQRASWTESRTGKTMPILIAVHVGDIIESGRLVYGRHPGPDPAMAEAEWQVASGAFDILDGCGLPYVVVPGNHDRDTSARGPYNQRTDGYNRFFGAPCMASNPSSILCSQGYDPGAGIFASSSYAPRPGWADHACQDPPACDWPEEWFLGNGDDIRPDSRNLLPGEKSGPPAAQPGRHRAAVVRAPSGQPFLFVGLDNGFDFDLPPPHGDDLAWVEGLMDAFAGVPTILVHHWMWARPGSGFSQAPEYDIDSLEQPGFPAGSSEPAWNELVRDRPQVVLTVNGHFRGTSQNVERSSPSEVGAPGRRVYSLFRNVLRWDPDRSGMGWVTFLVFDPGQGQIRARWHRIDTGNALHTGTPAIFDDDLNFGSESHCHEDPDGVPTDPFDPDCEYIMDFDFNRSSDARVAE